MGIRRSPVGDRTQPHRSAVAEASPLPQPTPPACPETRLRATIARFVDRARRIENHSLARDRAQLLRYASLEVTLARDSDGVITATIPLPPEEPLESLAARCRPFILQGDGIHYRDVFGALGYFIRTDPLRQTLEKIREQWVRLDPATAEGISFQTAIATGDGPFSTYLDDKVQAYSWLYGDLVHAGPWTMYRHSSMS